MPVVDRREFGGRFNVKENGQRLANYRYLEVQLMEMIGGWSHTTPQLAFKAIFGYHVYDHVQAADLLGERLEQLRSGRDREEPATDDFARLCEHVWKLESTIERLVAVYRVLEPHLVSTYVYHADATDPLTDTLTVRLLRQLAAFGQSHIAWGQAVLEALTQSPADRKRALEVQADIEGQLVAIAPVGANLPEAQRDALVNHPGMKIHASAAEVFASEGLGQQQVWIDQEADLGLHVQRLDAAAAVHIVNYAYDSVQDRVVPVEGVELAIRLSQRYAAASVFVPGAQPQRIEVDGADTIHRVRLDHLGVYTIVQFHDDGVVQAG
ncbi:MAG: hypothetical protein CYG59_11790 [Chloroflexi bacterium]|nr:MAG: hypothetical protein CYG59_11790 [Chloroflexota bacterium]